MASRRSVEAPGSSSSPKCRSLTTSRLDSRAPVGVPWGGDGAPARPWGGDDGGTAESVMRVLSFLHDGSPRARQCARTHHDDLVHMYASRDDRHAADRAAITWRAAMTIRGCPW